MGIGLGMEEKENLGQYFAQTALELCGELETPQVLGLLIPPKCWGYGVVVCGTC